MKILIVFLVSFVTIFNVQARTINEVAIVGSHHITKFELENRRKLILLLQNIEPSEANLKQYNSLALRTLIDDNILADYADKISKKVTDKEIDLAIDNIEQSSKMPKGYMSGFLNHHNLTVSFKQQIKSELIKDSVVHELAQGSFVSPRELNSAILFSNVKDAEIDYQVFLSEDKSGASLKKMNSLKNKLSTCDNIPAKEYHSFVKMTRFKTKLSQLTMQDAPLVKDLSMGQTSSVVEEGDHLKIVQLCNRTILNLNNDEKEYFTNVINQNKVSKKAQNFLNNLRKKAYIKILSD